MSRERRTYEELEAILLELRAAKPNPTLADLGKALGGVTRERARQILRQAGLPNPDPTWWHNSHRSSDIHDT